MIVDRLRSVEAAPRLGQLRLRPAGEQRQQRLWSAVADDVVAAEHVGAQLVDDEAVRVGQLADPRRARHRVETEHEYVGATVAFLGVGAQTTAAFEGHQVDGDARVQADMDGAVRADARDDVTQLMTSSTS